MRRGFTLLEMMISIVIFSLITIYLYQTLGTLRQSNAYHSDKLGEVGERGLILKTLFLDLSLSAKGSVEIIKEEKLVDFLFMQTSNSVHRRIMPYVGYIVREDVLYRIESPVKIERPIEVTDHIIVDKIGPVEIFRLYSNATHFLLNIKFKNSTEQLLKVRALNH
ncbi:MAG: prepilin-type N-terminal cleavage/methylation domain-containing protein [Sulfurimonadaceae bacterium]|nr:prepilin-type N-terminal cleavage/methylation domain-containing protein [Sulfurimonadaceae bacterium]